MEPKPIINMHRNDTIFPGEPTVYSETLWKIKKDYNVIKWYMYCYET